MATFETRVHSSRAVPLPISTRSPATMAPMLATFSARWPELESLLTVVEAAAALCPLSCTNELGC